MGPCRCTRPSPVRISARCGRVHRAHARWPSVQRVLSGGSTCALCMTTSVLIINYIYLYMYFLPLPGQAGYDLGRQCYCNVAALCSLPPAPAPPTHSNSAPHNSPAMLAGEPSARLGSYEAAEYPLSVECEVE